MNLNCDFKDLNERTMNRDEFLKPFLLRSAVAISILGFAFWMLLTSSVLAEEEPPSEAGQTSSSDQETLEELQEHLTAEERPVRQNAASDLVLRTSSAATELVSSLLTKGSDQEKEALLTAIAGQVGEEDSVAHLLRPILRTYSRKTNGSDRALIEAISYFSDSALLETVRGLLTQLANKKEDPGSPAILQKARLIRVLGDSQVQVDPIALGNQLYSISDQLPPVLHPELLIVLQKRFQFYEMTTFEAWKEWWKQHQSESDAEIYRTLLQQKSDVALKEWKTSVKRLFTPSEQGGEPVISDLLSVNDPRKLVFLLQNVRNQSKPDRFVSDGSSIIELLTNQQHPRVLREVIKTIGTLELKKARSDVEKFVDHYRPSVRKITANTLGVIGNKKSGKRLIEQFEREDISAVLIAILDAFRDLKYQESIMTLQDRLMQDTGLKDSVRNEIVSTLGTLQQVKSLPVLTSLLQQSEPEKEVTLRFNIALSIGQIGSVEGVPALIELTDAPTPSVRGAAAQALGNISFTEDQNGSSQREKALSALFKLLRQSEDATVKRRAAKSLSSIALPGTVDQLAELIAGRENGVEDVIRSSLKNTLQQYPEKLSNVIPVLQGAGQHTLVREIAGSMSDEALDELPEDQRNRLFVEFAESYLATSDWSSVLSILDRVTQEDLSATVTLLRARAYIGLGNYTEASSSLDDLEEQVEQGTSGWWRIQYLRARMRYRKGPVREAISFIQNELRPQSPPDSINEKLKQIEEKHKTVLAEISMRLEELLTQEDTDNPDGDQEQENEKHLNTLLGDERYHTFVVRRALEKLPSKPEDVRSKLTPTLVRLLNEITGCNVSYSENIEAKTVSNMINEWESWLTNQGDKKADSGASQDSSGS